MLLISILCTATFPRASLIIALTNDFNAINGNKATHTPHTVAPINVFLPCRLGPNKTSQIFQQPKSAARDLDPLFILNG